MVIVLNKPLLKHPADESIVLDLKQGTEMKVIANNYVKAYTHGPILSGNVYIKTDTLLSQGLASIK